MFSPDWAPIMLQTPWIWSCPLLSRHADITYCWWAEIFLQHQRFWNKTAMTLMNNANLPKNPSLNHTHWHPVTYTHARVRILTHTHTHTLHPINPKGNQKYIAAATKKNGSLSLYKWIWYLLCCRWCQLCFCTLPCPSPNISRKKIFHIWTNKHWSITTNNV